MIEWHRVYQAIRAGDYPGLDAVPARNHAVHSGVLRDAAQSLSKRDFERLLGRQGRRIISFDGLRMRFCLLRIRAIAYSSGRPYLAQGAMPDCYPITDLQATGTVLSANHVGFPDAGNEFGSVRRSSRRFFAAPIKHAIALAQDAIPPAPVASGSSPNS